MKNLLGTMAMLLVATICFAQNKQTKLVGKVLDASTKEPIVAASIRIGTQTATTNDAGVFEVKNLAKGVYQLTIASIGYEENVQPVQLQQLSERLVFTLLRKETTLQPLEVTSVRAAEQAPFTKTNLSKAQIAKNNLGQDLPFLFNQTPSAVVTSDAGNGVGYTGIRIRGTDATRINVTLNGIPYNDAESQGTFFVNIPDFASSLSSVQIQRGVGTSSNGAGAFGATINLSTNETIEKPYAEFNNTYGSFNTWKNTVKAGSGLLNNHFTVDVRLSQISSDGFIDRAFSNLKSFAISTAYLSKKTSVRFNIFSGKEKTFQAWNGVPEAKLRNDAAGLLNHYYNNMGVLYFTEADSANLFNSNPRKFNGFLYPNQTDNYQQDHYQLFVNHAISKKISFNAATFLTYGRGYYEEYKNSAKFSSYGLPNLMINGSEIQRTDLVRQLWLNNYFYGGIFSANYKDVNKEITLGGAINQYDGDHYGNIVWANMGINKDHRWYNFTAKKTDANIYTKAQVKLTNELQFMGDLQYRTVGYHFTGTRKYPTLHVNENYHYFNPKVGMYYAHKLFNAYISYAIANKEPNRNDFEIESTLPKPQTETLNDLEIGFNQQRKNYQWGITGYYMHYNNQLVLTGKLNDVGDPIRANIPNSYRLGIELQGKLAITSWIGLEANAAFSQNKVTNFVESVPVYDANFEFTGYNNTVHKSSNIAFSPNTVINALVNVFPTKNLELSFINKYVGKQYLDNASNEARKINSYFVQDIRAIYTCKKWLKETNLVLQVNNVFNKQYETNGYTYSYFYTTTPVTENFYFPMAGTNFMLALQVKL